MKKGDLISRVTNDITTLEDSISEIIPGVIYNIVLMIGTLIMMFYISFTLSIISVLIIPVSIIVLSLFVKKIQKYFDLNQKQLGEINSFIEQSITNQNVISSFNKEKYYNEEFENVNDELYIYTFKSTLYSSCAGPIMSFLSNFNYILVIGIGAFNVIKGSLQIGGVQAFIGYIKSFTRTVTDMANSLLNIQLSFASAKRIFEILDIENEVEGEIKELTLKDSIIFKDVCFSYKKDTPILNNLNLTIKKGQQIAIVGTTGAGKTTLINLLMRFYDIDSGSITIDNKNINELNKDTLRSKIGMVLQNTWVFEGNIKENLLFDKVLTEDSFEKLIEDSKIRHLISSLPGGINYKINEEASNISDGEKQLLTIARALAYNPEVLILDEATSNVDSRLEYILNASMKKLMKNRTCLIIAHRLSTIVEADKIVVLENGSIIEEGTHSYLLAKKGAYYNLYNSQFGLIDE
ncbi:MAG: ABC transporter ATP-binding protein, partial [Bacilli bacterium]